jgi:hypothetical protein
MTEKRNVLSTGHGTGVSGSPPGRALIQVGSTRTGRVWGWKSYLGCHILVNTLVPRRIPVPITGGPVCMCECVGYVHKSKSSEGNGIYFVYYLLGELEHLKMKTRLIDENFAIVMGECVFVQV